MGKTAAEQGAPANRVPSEPRSFGGTSAPSEPGSFGRTGGPGGFGGPGGPMGRFLRERQKPKNLRKTVGRLLYFFKDYKYKLIVNTLLIAGVSAAAVARPMLIGLAIDALDTGGISKPLLILAALAMLYVSESVMRFGQGWLITGISQRVVQTVRKALFAKLHVLPLSYFDSHTHGELMSRLSNDTDNIAGILATAITQLISIVIVLGGTLFMMLRLSPTMTLAALVSVPLVFLLTRTVSKRTRLLFKEQQAALGRLNAIIEEDVTGMAVVRAYGQEKRALADFAETNERLRSVSTRALIWSGYIMPVMNVINNLSFSIVAGVGSVLALRGALSVGAIASFIQYSRQFGGPLNEMAATYNQFLSALASAERVFEVMDREPETPDRESAVTMSAPRGKIEFKDVCFEYAPGEPVLKNISFTAPSGSVIAFVGPTGAGKTTVINLAARFYDPVSGEITIDGRDGRDYTRDSLRRCFGIVLQDTYLFTGTVMENIRYGQEALDEAAGSEERAKEAAKTAGVHSFIERLPQGYETVLTENSQNLSQGQKQMIAIARAILSDPAILILDEATSSVDTRTELKIQEAMTRLMKGRTCFIIAHRLSTISGADMIFVIKDGEIAEYGTHGELMQAGGAYSRMHGINKV